MCCRCVNFRASVSGNAPSTFPQRAAHLSEIEDEIGARIRPANEDLMVNRA